MLVFAGYLAFAVFAIPLLLRPVLEDFVWDLSGRYLRVEQIRFQPLTLTVVVEHASLAPADERAAWQGSASVERVSARLGLRRLTPQITRLDLRVLQLGIDKADATPFDLLSALPEARRPEHWLRTLPVQQVHIEDGQVSLRSAGTSQITWNMLGLQSVRTAIGRDFEVALEADNGVRWQAAGSLDWPGRLAKGRYRVERLDLAAFSDWFGLDLQTGSEARVGAEGDFQLYRHGDRWQIDLPNNSAQSEHLELCTDTNACALLRPFAVQFDASISQAPGDFYLESARANLGALEIVPGGLEESTIAVSSLVVTLESFTSNGSGRGRLDILAESAQGGSAQFSAWLRPASMAGEIGFSLTAWPLRDLWLASSDQRLLGNAYTPTAGELSGSGEAWIDGGGFRGLGSFVANGAKFEHTLGHTIAIGKLSAPAVGLAGWPLQAESSRLEVESPSLSLDSAEMWSLLAPPPAINSAIGDEQCQSITNVRISDGRVTLRSAKRPFVLSSLDGWVSGLCDGRWSAFELTGGEQGGTQLQASGRTEGPIDQSSVMLALKLEDPSAALTEPSLQRWFDGRIAAKGLKLDLAYRLGRDLWSGVQRVELANFEVLPGTGDSDLGPDWIAALLMRPDHTVRLKLQGSKLAIPSPRSLTTLLESAIDDYLPDTDATPLQALVKLNGLGALALGEIPFEPGNAVIGPQAAERLSALGSALRHRPQVLLRLTGVFDPVLDRRALQILQLRTHVALATASRLALQSGNLPLDFSDPKVHSVLDEFASRRMPGAALEAFDQQLGLPDGEAGPLPAARGENYYAALFEVLVEYSVVPDSTLASLARYRQQAVADDLAARGIDHGRLLRGDTAIAVQSRGVGITLPVALELAASGVPQPVQVGQPPEDPSVTRE